MKTSLLMLFCWLLLAPQTYGQIEDIKEKSEEQEEKKDKEDKDEKDKGKYNAEEDEDEMPDCAKSFAETAFRVGFEIIGVTLVQHHKVMMRNRDMYPEALSFELMPQMVFSPKYHEWNAMPRIRGTWGVLSSDLRYSLMHDTTGDLSLWEWQILQLNFNWNPRFRTRIGSGIFYNNHIGKAYNEHSLVVDIQILPQWELSLEGRLALDYDPEAPVNNIYSEMTARNDIRLLRTQQFILYLSAGYMYQHFYQAVEFNGVLGGLRLVWY